MEVQDSPASRELQCQKVRFSKTAQTTTQISRATTPSASFLNLSLEIKRLIAFGVRSASRDDAIPPGELGEHHAGKDPDLRSLANTCRDLRAACRPLLWENLTVQLEGYQYGRGSLMDFLPSIGSAVKEVTLSVEVTHFGDEDLCDEQEPGDDEEPSEKDHLWSSADVFRLCPNLRACRLSLWLWYPDPSPASAFEDLIDALGSLKQLSSTSVETATFDGQPSIAAQLVKGLPLVESVSLYGMGSDSPDDSKLLADRLATLSHLKHLSIQHSTSLIEPLAKAPFDNSNSIQSLSVVDSFASIRSEKLYAFLSPFASSIRCLHLDITVSFSDAEDLYHLPHLQTLTVVGPWGFNPPLLRAFAPCVSLSTIHIHLSTATDHDTFDAWMSGPLPPSLRIVHLYHGRIFLGSRYPSREEPKE